ncbi:UNVERIFIED_CONTAM: putative ribosomal large subunit pseudouridine synthase SVR1, chloroplastic [Sesamum radiatum]|uniref:Ribosomal large subunit pseudouridine synthase SVR1, chloroplastic n=1 Tax=Sesamum radiatum TaxID=300843 RepID=A0AAW2TGQ9_SESRA
MIAAAATAFTTLHLSRTSFILPSRRLPTFVTSSFSSTITAEFNIKFAPPKPKPQLPNPSAPDLDPPDSSTSELGDQLFIPWIVRDENGNLTLRATPPERFLKAMAHQNSQKKKKKDVKSAANKVKQAAPSAEPKYSKAARRFYNERFREPPAAREVASRRSSEELIFQGKVTVNGSVCNTPQTRVDPDRDVIYVNGNRLPKKLPPKVYLALNKPKGYICSAGEKETKSVMTLFDDFMKSWSKRNPGLPRPRLFTVGRLDVATTGLIIVTNDGEFANKVSHPSSNLSKEYIATINGAVSKRHLFAISEGTVIEGVHCTPDSVELLPQQPDISRPRLRIVVGGLSRLVVWYNVLQAYCSYLDCNNSPTVHEGRNHEVRELVKNAGLQIHALKRVRIGGFKLPTDLALGKHVELSSANLRALGWKS